jgi:hypothetical protein
MPVSMLVVSVLAAIVLFVAVRFAGAWLRFRGARVIACPGDLRPAGVQLDARRAAQAAVLSSPHLQLSSCSRWPEKAGCGQECLRQIAASPDGCLVRNLLLRWYEGKSCALCGQPIGPIHRLEQRPGLLSEDHVAIDWNDVSAEQLPAVLETSRAVCVSCHLAASFVRQHPELVTDRSRPA